MAVMLSAEGSTCFGLAQDVSTVLGIELSPGILGRAAGVQRLR